MSEPTLAFSGLGQMGGTLARKLRDQGLRLRVYDQAREVRVRFEEEGFQTSETLSAAASGAEVLMLCLPDAAAVESSLPEILAASPRPSLCIDLTSSEPAGSKRNAARLRSDGVAMVDSPVSGGVAGARAGSLTAMVGGGEEDLEAARPWLRHFASSVMWAGPLGSGAIAKAINNALSASALSATAELFVAATRSGEEPDRVVEAFNRGHCRSQNSEVKFPAQVLTRRFAAGFSAGLMLKDIRIAMGIASSLQLSPPFTGLLAELWQGLVGRLGPQADFTQVVEFYEECSALSPRRPESRSSSRLL